MLIHTQVEAHKLILAASGPFLHAILKKNKHPHPLVFMRGVKLEGLVNLLCSEIGTQTFVESETIESKIEVRCEYTEADADGHFETGSGLNFVARDFEWREGRWLGVHNKTLVAFDTSGL